MEKQDALLEADSARQPFAICVCALLAVVLVKLQLKSKLACTSINLSHYNANDCAEITIPTPSFQINLRLT